MALQAGRVGYKTQLHARDMNYQSCGVGEYFHHHSKGFKHTPTDRDCAFLAELCYNIDVYCHLQ